MVKYLGLEWIKALFGSREGGPLQEIVRELGMTAFVNDLHERGGHLESKRDLLAWLLFEVIIVQINEVEVNPLEPIVFQSIFRYLPHVAKHMEFVFWWLEVLDPAETWVVKVRGEKYLNRSVLALVANKGKLIEFNVLLVSINILKLFRASNGPTGRSFQVIESPL